MRNKEDKKLHLNKLTIQDFVLVLDRDQQKDIKGGYSANLLGLTNIPVVCIP